jgi:hypothetical protein
MEASGSASLILWDCESTISSVVDQVCRLRIFEPCLSLLNHYKFIGLPREWSHGIVFAVPPPNHVRPLLQAAK